MTARIFVGSSSENLDLARAVQANLEPEFVTDVWDQGVFLPSQYPLESLLEQLERSDFGVFVLAPDDLIVLRGKRVRVPRDNVIFELGVFVGRLGHDRTFIILPRRVGNIHLPSDLAGLNRAHYNIRPNDPNYIAALGSACNQIRIVIRKKGSPAGASSRGTVRVGFFSTFAKDFPSLIQEARTIKVHFIHSRRWREENDSHLKDHLKKRSSSLLIYLPDLTNRRLIEELLARFEDGAHIPSFIADAYRYFGDLQKKNPRKIRIRLYSFMPSYSFYMFDQRVIFAIYPNTPSKKDVPTFDARLDGPIGRFFAQEIKDIQTHSRAPSSMEVQSLARKYSGTVPKR